MVQVNIVHYNEERLKKMPNSTFVNPEAARPPFFHGFPRDDSNTKTQNPGEPLSLSTAPRDLEMPMPPPALAPVQQHGIR